MLGVLLHLSTSQDFLLAVAADQRSYSDPLFCKALRTAAKYRILQPEQLAQLERSVRELRGRGQGQVLLLPLLYPVV